ncbi:MAG TPA: glycosyltransferase [Bryobacteraceae bacterium]|nr:glycosyltransferase [Bryobacteraceae bacterium]
MNSLAPQQVKPAPPAERTPVGVSAMKVLQVGKYYPPHMGGIETHLQALCGELHKSVDLRVLVSSDDTEGVEQVLDGVRVSRIPTRLTVASTPLCPAMVTAIRRSAADIIHLHLPNPGAVLAYLASGHRGRLVITYHSDTVRQKVLGALFEPCLHMALRRSAAIIATSPDYRRTSPVLARYLDRCSVIPYGIALEQFERADAAAISEVRQRYGDRLILSVGRLVYYKGFEYLIRAMQQVRGKLIIIGDGPLRGKLEELAATLGISERVVFAGEIQNQNVTPYYHAADVFALASIARSEAFGIVQIEAMAAGLPVVNTRLDSGVPFVSLHDQTGITVPPGDPDALARALNKLLDNADLRKSLGSASILRARQEFSLEGMTSRVLRLYEDILRGRTSGHA